MGDVIAVLVLLNQHGELAEFRFRHVFLHVVDYITGTKQR
jgi:hypothetical protein